MKLQRSHAIILFLVLLAGYVYFFKINNILENMAGMRYTTPYKSCDKTKCYEKCQSDEACLQGHDECEGCNLETRKGSTFSPVVISNAENIHANTTLLKNLNPSVIIVNDNMENVNDNNQSNEMQVPIVQNNDPTYIPQKTTGMMTDTENI